MTPFAPRIHVLLARDAPVGVVIRRGPSRRVATLLWDRRTDEFRLGQWLKGRIYERRCDLSPDGQHLLYFAMNGRWQAEARGSWTAVSRAPYLKALAVFPKGDCWHGGGLWTGPRTYWLNDGYGHEILRDTAAVRRDRRFQPAVSYGGECPGVYFPRLLREGWTLREEVTEARSKQRFIFEKPLPARWVLRKVAHAEVGAPPGRGCYWDEHELIHPALDRPASFPRWEWADLDRDRLVWAADGKLYGGRVGGDGVAAETLLHDFSGMEFSPIEAPY